MSLTNLSIVGLPKSLVALFVAVLPVDTQPPSALTSCRQNASWNTNYTKAMHFSSRLNAASIRDYANSKTYVELDEHDLLRKPSSTMSAGEGNIGRLHCAAHADVESGIRKTTTVEVQSNL